MDINDANTRLIQKKRGNMIVKLIRGSIDFSSITCDECEANVRCQYAYDPYNTDGDCYVTK